MSPRRHDLLLVHLPAVAWLAAMTVALAVPSDVADLPGWVPRFLHFHALDKVIHGFLFAGAGLLVARSFRRLPGVPRPVLAAFLALVAYGAATEVGQHLFTDRAGEAADVGADVLGAGLGVAVLGLGRSGR